MYDPLTEYYRRAKSLHPKPFTDEAGNLWFFQDVELISFEEILRHYWILTQAIVPRDGSNTPPLIKHHFDYIIHIARLRK